MNSTDLKEVAATFAIFDMIREEPDDERAELRAERALDAALEMRKDEIRIRAQSAQAA